MRTSINLASKPFVELRPLFARLRLAMAVLALVAVGLGFWLQALSVKAAKAQAQMNDLRAKTQRLQDDRLRNEARMKQPHNRAVLDRSQFLNQLFANKSFSWTAVMMDLERVLPTGVQVTSIQPVISPDGVVSIRLRVSGDRDQAVQLVRNLERSQRFLDSRLSGESAQSNDTAKALAVSGVPTGPPKVEFDIISGYNPLPPVAIKSAKPATDATDVPADKPVRKPRKAAAPRVPVTPGGAR
jgi:type IV pilus assembly protein PilN